MASPETYGLDSSVQEARRPYSIDLALELEQQLGNEPACSSARPTDRPQSLDPHILANLVAQLRHTVAEVTKERDALQHMLAYVTSQSAELKDNLQFITEKCAAMEVELEEAKKRTKEDEEAIGMLRSKVDESRYGPFSGWRSHPHYISITDAPSCGCRQSQERHDVCPKDQCHWNPPALEFP